MKNNSGFTIVELLVAIGILALMTVLMAGFVVSLKYSNTKTRADRESLENARRALDEMVFEIRRAESVYTPTTTGSQLSLESENYLPYGETTSYIDFFLCGSALCIKKESQDPIALTPDTVQVTTLSFTRIANGTNTSVKIDMTVAHVNTNNDPAAASSTTLTSTVSLRSY